MAFDEQEYTQILRHPRLEEAAALSCGPIAALIAVVLVLNVVCARDRHRRCRCSSAMPSTTSSSGGTLSGPAGSSPLFYVGVIALQALAVILLHPRAPCASRCSLGRDMKRACFVHLQTLSLLLLQRHARWAISSPAS